LAGDGRRPGMRSWHAESRATSARTRLRRISPVAPAAPGSRRRCGARATSSWGVSWSAPRDGACCLERWTVGGSATAAWSILTCRHAGMQGAGALDITILGTDTCTWREWLEPRLVAEVRYAEAIPGGGGLLRFGGSRWVFNPANTRGTQQHRG